MYDWRGVFEVVNESAEEASSLDTSVERVEPLGQRYERVRAAKTRGPVIAHVGFARNSNCDGVELSPAALRKELVSTVPLVSSLVDIIPLLYVVSVLLAVCVADNNE